MDLRRRRQSKEVSTASVADTNMPPLAREAHKTVVDKSCATPQGRRIRCCSAAVTGQLLSVRISLMHHHSSCVRRFMPHVSPLSVLSKINCAAHYSSLNWCPCLKKNGKCSEWMILSHDFES